MAPIFPDTLRTLFHRDTAWPRDTTIDSCEASGLLGCRDPYTRSKVRVKAEEENCENAPGRVSRVGALSASLAPSLATRQRFFLAGPAPTENSRRFPGYAG